MCYVLFANKDNIESIYPVLDIIRLKEKNNTPVFIISEKLVDESLLNQIQLSGFEAELEKIINEKDIEKVINYLIKEKK
jgi:hypothetical protein